MGAFLGAMNEFEGTVGEDGRVTIELGTVYCRVSAGGKEKMIVAIRTEKLFAARLSVTL